MSARDVDKDLLISSFAGSSISARSAAACAQKLSSISPLTFSVRQLDPGLERNGSPVALAAVFFRIRSYH
jgi:hypothetical protein